MPADICIREKSEKVLEKAQELGWRDPGGYETKFLDADDWGELKRKIKDAREDAEILVFEGDDEKLLRKVASDHRVDVILDPRVGEKGQCIDKVIAEEAAEKNVAIGLSLEKMLGAGKEQNYRILSSWREILETCEKYGADYIFTTAASQVSELRSPRDLASVLDSLGFDGKRAVELQEEILKRNLEKQGEEHVRGGVRKREE
jgi:RNase P/RNase MRP subunit p30